MELRRELRMYGDDVRSLVHPSRAPPATPGPSPTAACVSFHPTFYPQRRHALTDIPHRPVPTIHSQDEDDAVMGTPPRSRPGAASRFGTTDRPATSTGLLHRPTSSSFAVKTAGPGRSSLAHDAIEERPSRRPATSSNSTAINRGLGSRPMSASKERLMGQYSSLGKLAMATPGGKENRWDGVPGSARRRPTTPRDLYDYNGRRIDPSARATTTTTTREAFTPRSNLRELDESDSRGRAGGAPRTNATEHGVQRAAAARPPRAPRSTSRNTTATAGGSPATGGCDATSRSRRRERRRRDDDS